MEITKDQFRAYEGVRASGVINMWDVRTVKKLSKLNEETIHEIMKRYSELNTLFPDVRHNRV